MARMPFQRGPAPLVALLTDFGTRDHYAGVMKGVIHGICRDATVVDLSHEIAPQDVTEAAFVISSAYGYFPPGTIFVCVVDPGVGSERAIVCMCANRQMFLAPDNGLLSVVASESPPQAIYAARNQRYFLSPVSRTFHGRDIFAPVAAHLATGVDPKELGPPLARVHGLRLPRPIKTAGGVLRGEVIHVDRFGNLITNVTEGTLQTAFRGRQDRIRITVKGGQIRGLRASYSEVPEGELLALVGSGGYVEVAAHHASAAQMLGCGKGEPVKVAPAGSESA